ncbi:calcium/sodium antiporter [Clostridiaceae bacterium HSG29]|nr:calcium/sodium antiporter [Clostridiaceae bacterium HSG29]
MNMYLVYLLFAVGLILIIKGGDLFVDAAVWLAEITGIPHIIIGATVVSLGTTLPELFVSVNASLKGISDIAIGNAVGSTICNTGLVASLIIIFASGEINRNAYIKKGLLLILSIFSVFYFSIDLVISKYESIFLFILLLIYIILNIRLSKKSSSTVSVEEIDQSNDALIKNGLKFVFGLLFIIFGANFLVDNGVIIAKHFNVPESIVALTLVAFGTSLPELITGISSIVKGNHHIGLGNIIGANILNYIMIIPTASFFSKNGLIINKYSFDIMGHSFSDVAQSLKLDIPISLLMTFLFIFPVIIKEKNYRSQGFIILSTYIVYLGILLNIAI